MKRIENFLYNDIVHLKDYGKMVLEMQWLWLNSYSF